MAENPGAEAAQAREAQLVRRLTTSAELDGQFEEILHDAVQRALISRQRLASIEAEVRQAAVSWPGLDTPAGARQFQRFLAVKTREVHSVVAAATADSQHKAQLAQALAGRYPISDPAQIGTPEPPGHG